MEETVQLYPGWGGTPLNEVIGDSRLFLPMRPEVQDMISSPFLVNPSNVCMHSFNSWVLVGPSNKTLGTSFWICWWGDFGSIMAGQPTPPNVAGGVRWAVRGLGWPAMSPFPIGTMGLLFLPAETQKSQRNVRTCATHGSYGFWL